MEILNPAETFGDIMVDYSYVECSSACISALCAFRKRHPEYQTHPILTALGRGKEYIESIQRADGSWCAALCCSQCCMLCCGTLCMHCSLAQNTVMCHESCRQP